MNKLLIHFLLSSVKKQVTDSINKKFPDNKNGELLSISYLGEKDKIIQRVKFENYSGDAVLDEEDKKMFKSIPGVDIDKELKSCESIIVNFNLVKEEIKVVYYYSDKTEKVLNF